MIAPIYAAGKPFVDGKAVEMIGDKEVVLERPSAAKARGARSAST